MVLSLAKWRKRLKFIIFFILFSYLLYLTLGVASEWLQQGERYKAPTGKAVKVIQQEAVAEQRLTLKDRLAFFYWYGE